MKMAVFSLTIVTALVFGCSGCVHALSLADEAETPGPSVTVFPVTLAPTDFPDEFSSRVGTVLATFLEQGGLTQLEVAKEHWKPRAELTQERLEQSFSEHVRSMGVATDFCVFVRIEGTPTTGAKVIRTVVADRTGQIVFSEEAGEKELAAADPAPKEPMTCCMFVARRLQVLWKLKDPFRADAPKGRLAEFWRKDAGIPDDAELAMMSDRRRTLTQARNPQVELRLIVSPATSKSGDADKLAQRLNESMAADFRANRGDSTLRSIEHSNEQKVLWTLATEFQKSVRSSNSPKAYSLCVDIGMAENTVRYVLMIVCDQNGEWVFVDMLNSHHPDFERAAPESPDQCFPMIAARLESLFGRRP